MDEGPSRDDRDSGTSSRGEPRRLGRYRVLAEKGRGSNGVVYEAIDEHLDRRVALKVLPANISLDEKTIKRFYREAEAAARLTHAGIVPIYEINEVDGTHYYAMEFVDGVSLDIFASTHDVSQRDAARMIRDAALALHAAHERGVVHRDVKPSNLLVRANGDVLVSDFGLARHDKSATLTSTDAIVGTPRYMSPEQIVARQSRVDRRSDVYSLGVTLYELLTGKPPFDAETIQSFLKQVLEEPPTPPRKRRRSISRELETIVLKAIARDVGDRYQTADELAKDLDRFLHSEPIAARRPGFVARAREYAARHRVQVLTGALVVAGVLVLALAWRTSSQGKESSYQRLMNEATASRDAGDYDAAIKALDEAIRVRGDGSDAYLERARVLLLRYASGGNDLDPRLVARAAEDVARARRNGATDEETLEPRTEIAFLQQRWEEARDLATRVLESTSLDDVRRARFLYIRGGSRLALGDLTRATQDLNGALTLAPDNKDVRDLLTKASKISGDSRLTERLKRIGNALADLGTEGSSTYGTITDAIVRLAASSSRFSRIGADLFRDVVMNAQAGGESQASEEFETYRKRVEESPGDVAALIGLGRARMRLGWYRKDEAEREPYFRAAMADFRSAYDPDRTRTDDTWEAFYWSAFLGATAKDESALWDPGVASFEAEYAVALAPDDRRVEARDVQAEVAFRAGNKADAIQIIDDLLKSDPDRAEYYQRRRAFFVEHS